MAGKAVVAVGLLLGLGALAGCGGGGASSTACTICSQVIREDYGKQLRPKGGQVNELTCNVNADGNTATCLGRISIVRSRISESESVRFNVTFGREGLLLWKAKPVSCKNTKTGKTVRCR